MERLPKRPSLLTSVSISDTILHMAKLDDLRKFYAKTDHERGFRFF